MSRPITVLRWTRSGRGPAPKCSSVTPTETVPNTPTSSRASPTSCRTSATVRWDGDKLEKSLMMRRKKFLVVKSLFRPVQVVLDLWEHLEMCKEGQMSWLSRQLDDANFIITVCSKGLRYFLFFLCFVYVRTTADILKCSQLQFLQRPLGAAKTLISECGGNNTIIYIS